MFLLTQVSLPHLMRGSGRIGNIVSISARGPPLNQTTYVGMKGMYDLFTKRWLVLFYIRNLSLFQDCYNRVKELPPNFGCTVNAVNPGLTMIEGFAAVGEE